MHHANLLVGSRAWALAHTPHAGAEGNPDIVYTVYERMSIADVRVLTHEAMLRPIREQERTFIVATNSILEEAQNALLKLFEEPNQHTIFYFIIPRVDQLLPTLLSRLNVLGVEEMISTRDSFEAFRVLPYPERFARILERLDAEDSEWVQDIVTGFQAYAHTSRDVHTMRDALMVATYMQRAGSSKKMLLEHIALSL